MQITLNSPVLALRPGQLLALDDAAGTCIAPRLGTLWITEEGKVEDTVVGPGEAHCVARQGRTVVQAFDAAWISILEKPASGLTREDCARFVAAEERLASLLWSRIRSRYY
jgi:hypothetical protein